MTVNSTVLRTVPWDSLTAQQVKKSAFSAGDTGDASLMSQSVRSPGGGNGNPPQYSCLENPMDRGAWRATVHRVAESVTTEHSATPQNCALVLMRHLILCVRLASPWYPDKWTNSNPAVSVKAFKK